MAGILGGGSPGGILGLLQQSQQTGQAPAYGSDAWAFQQGGPNVMLWRELMRGLSSQGLAALAPGNAEDVFSPMTRKLLAPEYQKQGK